MISVRAIKKINQIESSPAKFTCSNSTIKTKGKGVEYV